MDLFLAVVIVCIPIVLAIAAYLILHPRSALALLLIIMPFHTLTFLVLSVEMGLPSSLIAVLQMWREMLLVCLAIWVVLRLSSGYRLHLVHPQFMLLCIGFMLFGFVGLLNSPDLIGGIYGYRGTFAPLAFLILILCLPITDQWLRTVTPKLIFVGSLVAMFAIFQSLILGFDFVWKYYAREGVLSSSFIFMGGSLQRAMGTFSSPNQLSLYLVLVLLLALNLFLRSHAQRQKIRLGITLMLLSVALVLTVSRSGWLAAIIGIGFCFLIWKRRRNFVVAAVVGLIVAVPLFFALGLDQHLLNTVQGNEISANYRTGLTVKNIVTAIEHPLGVGFGLVGARATRFGADRQIYNTESYLLQMAMEIGLPGLLMFLLLAGWSFVLVYRNTFAVRSPFLRAWGVTALAAIIAALTHAMFIPDLQDLTVGMYLWFFVGIGLKLVQIQSSARAKVERTTREHLKSETRYLNRHRELEHQTTIARLS